MNIIQLPLGEVHPYKNNPRKNDGAVDAVAESIKQYGFLVPLVISADHEIITGHTRFKAAKKLGLSSVPCVIADELTEEQMARAVSLRGAIRKALQPDFSDVLLDLRARPAST